MLCVNVAKHRRSTRDCGCRNSYSFFFHYFFHCVGGVITSLKAEVVELARHATLRTLLELNPVKVRVLSSVLILSVFNETVLLSVID